LLVVPGSPGIVPFLPISPGVDFSVIETFLSGAEFDTPPYEGDPTTKYMICSTARCGSTLLCSLLQNTGVMGVPHEYFHLAQHGKQLVQRLIDKDLSRNVTMDEYLTTVMRYRTTPNGVFGIKGHYNQCQPHFKSGVISRCFGDMKYVFIRRRDMVAQAVSLVIASQTGKWTSHEEKQKDPSYNHETIEGAITVGVFHNYMWDLFFAENGIEACMVYYEDILERPNEEVQRVVDFVGVEAEVSVDVNDAGLQREATQINLEWQERYRSELKIKPSRS
jgi:LPS sulfotransferase NodH